MELDTDNLGGEAVNYETFLAILAERVRARGELVEALNVEPGAPGALARFIDNYERSREAAPADELSLIIKCELSSKLRSYVDPWLSSGLSADGSESPGNRKLPAKPVQTKRTPGNWANDLLDSVDYDTVRLLGVLYDPEGHADNLCKCRLAKCGRYFLKTPLRRYSLANALRSRYQYGTFCCLSHQKLASASIATKKQRSESESALIEFAATDLLSYPANRRDWRQDAKYKEKLAGKISGYIAKRNLYSYRTQVTANWVNRRLPRIEQRRLELAAK